MNIVIVNHYAGGPGFGMEFRPYYLAAEWKRAGHNVLIVASSYSHLRLRQPEVSSTLKREIVDGIDYLWIKVNSYKGNGIGRIRSMFGFTIKLYSKLDQILAAFKPDLIIASSTYPLDVIPLASISRKLRAKLCYEVHDLWPLSPMELGGYSKYHPFIMVMQFAENFAYRNADFVVSILPKTLDHMVLHGLNPEKFCYVPNGIVVEEWESTDHVTIHDEFLLNLKSQNKTIVGYVGGHAISNALDTLLEAASLVQKSNPDVMFVLVGDGADKQRLRSKSSELALTNLVFLNPVPKKSVPALLNRMDFLYLGWHDNPLYRFGISPNKLMDYMMAAKPIIHSVNAANDFVADSNCGISVAPNSPSLVEGAIVTLLKLREEERHEMGVNGREFVLKHHNYKALAKKFADFADKIVV